MGKLGTHSRRPKKTGPRHAWVYPAEERGRRIRWRTSTITLYLALVGAALWVAHILGWSERVGIPVVGVPYWAVTTAIWSRHGPEMPGLDRRSSPRRVDDQHDPPMIHVDVHKPR
jgi:hypothetical protein